jgi:hypothetical protein
VSSIPSPFRLRLYQNAAEFFFGVNLTPNRGKTVPPPRFTSVNYSSQKNGEKIDQFAERHIMFDWIDEIFMLRGDKRKKKTPNEKIKQKEIECNNELLTSVQSD